MLKIIIGGLILTFVLIAALAAVNTGINQSNVSDVSNTSAIEEGAISVTVSGEVNRPGTYLLEEDSTLADLLDSADGVTGNADSRCYYSDYELISGLSFYIAPIYDNSDVCAVTPIEKVNINSADKSALMEIDQIGTALASAIITYREETASFRSLEEIKNVDGIGPATYEKVKDYITLKD